MQVEDKELFTDETYLQTLLPKQEERRGRYMDTFVLPRESVVIPTVHQFFIHLISFVLCNGNTMSIEIIEK